MNYEFWHMTFIVSGILTAVFVILTAVLAIKFRIISLVQFRMQNGKHPSAYSLSGETFFPAGKQAVTEKLSAARQPENDFCDKTVIAAPEGGTVTASGSGFRITRNIVVISADPSVIDNYSERRK